MAKFLSAQKTAAALIAKFGGKVSLVRRVEGTFDPVTQQATGGGPQTFNFIAVITPPSQQARYTVGTLEGRNAVECYFSLKGQPIQPQPGDVVSVSGVDHRIFWAQTYDPAMDGPIFTLAYAERGA